jgi:3-oxoacyl-[acyl-carrier-protein] synthase-1
VSSAFASGLDSIGHAYELIAFDTLDLVVAGAAEERTWRTVGPAMEATGALVGPSERPASELCRPYDRDREGLVLSEGAGIVILEGLDHARARGARPLAEIVAYASANDGADMFHPSGEGLRLVLADALDQAHSHGVEAPDYVNTHATGTRVGDALEAAVLREFFSDCAHDPWVSSSKGQAGHAMGATGAQELVYSLLMLEHGFLAPTMNLRHLDAECGGLKHVTERRDEAANCVLKLSAGFGGSNACVVFRGFDSAAGRAG